MPAADIELIAKTQGHAYGRFVLTPTAGVTPSLIARRICTILASQFAAARRDQGTRA
jgi:hypothetical protein